MWRVVAESEAGYVLMHARGTPQTMQREAQYEMWCGKSANFLKIESTVCDHGVDWSN